MLSIQSGEFDVVFARDGILADAYPIREVVYVDEQKIDKEMEFDEFDDASLHLVVYERASGDSPTRVALAAGRVRLFGKSGEAVDFSVVYPQNKSATDRDACGARPTQVLPQQQLSSDVEGPLTLKVERLSVLKEHRGRKLGALLVRSIEAFARAFPQPPPQSTYKAMDGSEKVMEANLPRIGLLKLTAQSYAIGFYEKEGYSVISEEFMDVGIPHVWMTKSIA